MKTEKSGEVYPHLRRKLARIFTAFWDFLFPEECLGCCVRSTLLCDACLARLEHISERENVLTVFQYKSKPIKHALWLLKYRHHKNTAKIFAPFLYDAYMGKISEEQIHFGSEYRQEKTLLIPIPLVKHRRKKRGYNQALELGKNIMKLDETTLFELDEHALEKTRDTIPQAHLKNKKARLVNQQHCFRVTHPEKIHGRTILLIDDITTTGATFSEAENTLREAGAKEVHCLAVAH